MEEILITGVGQIPAGEHWDSSLREMGAKAVRLALQNAGNPEPQALFVGNMLSMNISNQAHLATLIADRADLVGIEAATVEAGGASGGAAIRQAVLAVKSGLVDCAIALGVEKFTDKAGGELESALATNMDGDFEAMQGLTTTSQAAMLMQRYLMQYKAERSAFAGFALNAHKNGAGNPNAMFQKAIKADTYLKAEMVSEPLNMFDIAPFVDGAAAIVLTRSSLNKGSAQPVKVSASALSTDTLSLHDRVDVLEFRSVARCAQKAFDQAGLRPGQINLFEYDDQFGIFAALALEATGFCERGQAWKMALEDEIGLGGRLPCATFGGNKARGFAGGATGIYQAVEAVLQLRGDAKANQVPGATHAMIQGIGGPGSTCVSHILSKI